MPRCVACFRLPDGETGTVEAVGVGDVGPDVGQLDYVIGEHRMRVTAPSLRDRWWPSSNR